VRAHRLDDFGQQLARLSNERFALLVFICSGGFADKHKLRVDAAYAEYNILS
jgi:hypothetical protein